MASAKHTSTPGVDRYFLSEPIWRRLSIDGASAQVQGWLLSNFDPQHLSNVSPAGQVLRKQCLALLQNVEDVVPHQKMDLD